MTILGLLCATEIVGIQTVCSASSETEDRNYHPRTDAPGTRYIPGIVHETRSNRRYPMQVPVGGRLQSVGGRLQSQPPQPPPPRAQQVQHQDSDTWSDNLWDNFGFDPDYDGGGLGDMKISKIFS